MEIATLNNDIKGEDLAITSIWLMTSKTEITFSVDVIFDHHLIYWVSQHLVPRGSVCADQYVVSCSLAQNNLEWNIYTVSSSGEWH
jgi:hypothetical protein